MQILGYSLGDFLELDFVSEATELRITHESHCPRCGKIVDFWTDTHGGYLCEFHDSCLGSNRAPRFKEKEKI